MGGGGVSCGNEKKTFKKESYLKKKVKATKPRAIGPVFAVPPYDPHRTHMGRRDLVSPGWEGDQFFLSPRPRPPHRAYPVIFPWDNFLPGTSGLPCVTHSTYPAI